MPFISKAQERACYAKNDPNWNCKEFATKHSKMAYKKRRKSSKKRRKSTKKRRKSSKKRRKSSKKRRKSSKKRRKSSKKRRKSSKKRRKSSKKRKKSSKKRKKSSKKRRKSSKKRRKSTKKRKRKVPLVERAKGRKAGPLPNKETIAFVKKGLNGFNKSISNNKNKWYLPVNLRGVVLGKGADGFVVKLCKGDDCNYALKVQKLNFQYEMEVSALRELQSTNAVPKIYDSWESDDRGYIIMEYIAPCGEIFEKEVLKNIRYNSAYELMKKIEDKGWLQVDMHLGNIRCRDGDINKLVLIDLGWCVKKSNGIYPKHPLSKRWSYNLNYDELKIISDYNFNINFYDEGVVTKNKVDYIGIIKAFNKVYSNTILYKTVNPSSFHDERIVYNDGN